MANLPLPASEFEGLFPNTQNSSKIEASTIPCRINLRMSREEIPNGCIEFCAQIELEIGMSAELSLVIEASHINLVLTPFRFCRSCAMS
jgi:hypothetical protein